MPRKIEIDNINDLIKIYKSGETINGISRIYGYPIDIIHKRFREKGIKPRSASESVWFDVNIKKIVREYLCGKSLKKISTEIGISRPAIIDKFKSIDVAIRGRSAAEIIKWQTLKKNRSLIERQCSAAWDSVRNKKRSYAELCKRAKAHEEKLDRIFTFENDIAKILQNDGVNIIQQKAVGAYNVDIAIKERPVAIEIVCCCPSIFKKTKQRERLKYFLNKNWFVIFVFCCGYKINFRHVRKHLLSLLQESSVDNSFIGKYGVVWGNGKMPTGSGYDLNGFPCIASTHSNVIFS